MLKQIMAWSKITHIKFQMTFINDEKRIKQMLQGHKDELIVVLNDPKTAKVLKKLNKRFKVAKDDWYKGLKL